MRRRLSALIVLILLFVLSSNAFALSPEDYNPAAPEQLTPDEIYAFSAILIDADTGETLFAKNADAPMNPASTTKIMTLLLGLERGIPLDQVVAIPQAAAEVPGDSTLIPVYPGEMMTYGDLLTAFMLCSGNDGANAVAVISAGSIENFVAMMNQRAAEIGCVNTHFVNAHGYTEDAHYTSPRDLAMITRTAMQNPDFRAIVGKTSAKVTISGRGEITVSSQHQIMKPNSGVYYRDCIGVKTGSTSAAGKCYVGAAERDGAMLISVVFRCDTDEQRWIDTTRLFDYGWTRYDTLYFDQIYREASGRIATFAVSNAKDDDPQNGYLSLDIAQISDNDYQQRVVSDNAEAHEVLVQDLIDHSTVQITHSLAAPITRGEPIGDLIYYNQESGQTITAKLVAARDVEEKPAFLRLTDLFPFLKLAENRTFVLLLAVLAVMIVLIIILVISRRAAKQRRRRQILERRRREYLRRQAAQGERGNAVPAGNRRTPGMSQRPQQRNRPR